MKGKDGRARKEKKSIPHTIRMVYTHEKEKEESILHTARMVYTPNEKEFY